MEIGLLFNNPQAPVAAGSGLLASGPATLKHFVKSTLLRGFRLVERFVF